MQRRCRCSAARRAHAAQNTFSLLEASGEAVRETHFDDSQSLATQMGPALTEGISSQILNPKPSRSVCEEEAFAN